MKEVNVATIGKVEMSLQMGLSAWAEHACKQDVLPRRLDTALSLMGTFPSCDKEEERALDRLCSKQKFHSLLLYDNIYAHALY